MKKNLLLIICLLVSSFVFSQISVSKRHTGKLKKHAVENFENFKSTTTVFVLSDCIKEKEYVKVLNDVWDVNDFIVVDEQEFNFLDFLDKDYSFVRFGGGVGSYSSMKTGRTLGTYVSAYIDFSRMDLSEFKKNIRKVKKPESKRGLRKINKILNENLYSIARIKLYPSNYFANKFNGSFNDMDECKYIYNYNLGFLKNYLQKINNLISSNKNYWMYENDYSEKLSTLVDETLYVPNYLESKYEKEYLKNLMSNYNYKYSVVTEDEMDNMILSNQEIHYLTYVNSNKEKFVQIVNSKTGDIIYRNYIANVASSSNLKPRHILDINKKIKKTLDK